MPRHAQIQQTPFYLAVAAVCAVFAAFVELPAILNWYRDCFHAFDLGIYAQVMRDIGLSNINPEVYYYAPRFFADHFDPIIIPASIGAKFIDPSLWAMLVELGFIVGGITLLVRAFQKFSFPPSLSLTLLALFLFSTGIVSALNYPVHPTTWSTFFFFLLAVALARNANGLVLFSAFALLWFKEEHVFVVAALSAWFAAKRQAQLSAALGALAAIWGLGVFVLRPKLLGPTSSYASNFIGSWITNPWAMLQITIFSGGNWRYWAELFGPFIPLLIWRARDKNMAAPRFNYGMLAALVPLVGIRFVANKWGFQYGAVLTASLIGLFIVVPRDEPEKGSGGSKKLFIASPPPLVIGLTVVLLLASQLQFYGKNSIKTLFRGGLSTCPAAPERLEEIATARQLIQKHTELPLYAIGNLVPRSIGYHKEVRMLLVGLDPKEDQFLWFSEGPPTGDPWAIGANRQYSGKRGGRELLHGQYVSLWLYGR